MKKAIILIIIFFFIAANVILFLKYRKPKGASLRECPDALLLDKMPCLTDTSIAGIIRSIYDRDYPCGPRKYYMVGDVSVPTTKYDEKWVEENRDLEVKEVW
ncbi:MAG: hypothetical protein PHS44_06465 [Candidatus Dojkabacteria bacterium]|nr:hypothetical protein [Candidatus Dojkabacteria bacterium]